jgi:cell division septum initiation protein DivIVA
MAIKHIGVSVELISNIIEKDLEENIKLKKKNKELKEQIDGNKL